MQEAFNSSRGSCIQIDKSVGISVPRCDSTNALLSTRISKSAVKDVVFNALSLNFKAVNNMGRSFSRSGDVICFETLAIRYEIAFKYAILFSNSNH